MRERVSRSRALPSILVALLTVGAIFAITTLVQRVDLSRRAELASASLQTETVQQLDAAPFSADPAFNSGPYRRSPKLAAIVAGEIRGLEGRLSAGLKAASKEGASAALVAAGRSDLKLAKPAIARVYSLATAPGGLAGTTGKTSAAAMRIGAAETELSARLHNVSQVLDAVAGADAATARRARWQAEVGTALAMLLLLAVIGYFYFRAERLARENEELLGVSRAEASTDALTGLANRRALSHDLHSAIGKQSGEGEELLVAIFDLDGFKEYNDTFGHDGGDALLKRLGARLSAAVEGSGTSYRMGGDEFCVVSSCAADSAQGLLDAAVAALSDGGEGWHVGCSHGSAWVPSEASASSEALRTADVRMYANKASRSSTGRQIADVLLQVLSEQDRTMNTHGDKVAELSEAVARAMELPEPDVQRITLAATLHDVGKTALPGSLLKKPGPLSPEEWEFMHQHTLIGERIVLAAPALSATAPLIRSSHERVDGGGYPDGLRGEEIPLGSRIIAACDTFDAMTSVRSYRGAASVEVTLEELRRCAGTQFDVDVVTALCRVAAEEGRAMSALSSAGRAG
jgi:diguanylate cyclase (GGDEF)-like protein